MQGLRMRVLASLMLLISVVAVSTLVYAATETSSGVKVSTIKSDLVEGNKRFMKGALTHPHQSVDRRAEIAAAQHPVAIVVSCSDSRVPPEILFDQGMGDLFVVRVAGNVLNDENIGSVEYAAEHLGTPLVVVLGHKRCGAVTAAVKGGEVPGHIAEIIKAIEPSVKAAKKKGGKGDLVEEASHLNVKRAVELLRSSQPLLAEMVKSGKLTIVGAYYDLDSGAVDFMK